MEMEGCSRKEEDYPQLLDLIYRERKWPLKAEDEVRISHGFSGEKTLELRLGLPGQDCSFKQDQTKNKNKEREENSSLISLGYFSSMIQKLSSSSYQGNIQCNQQQTTAPTFFQFPPTSKKSLSGITSKEVPQACCGKGVDGKDREKKGFSLPSSANTVVPNSSQKRSAPAAAVGWPPIRSFRKNLATSSSPKPAPDSQRVVSNNKVSGEKPAENTCKKGHFVKINMDGVPIGRKVDLSAHDSYEKLCSAVDELFRDLLAAQGDCSVSGNQNKEEEKKAIPGLLNGSGEEYTLVYEDNEGDRMLAGDVPWHVFVSNVKRLRVSKSSEFSARLSLGSSKKKDYNLSQQ